MATGMVEIWHLITLIASAIFVVFAYDYYDGKCDTIQADPNYRTNESHAKWVVDIDFQPVPAYRLSFKHSFGKFAPIARLYYKLWKIEYCEKFFLSSTLLVGFTDQWHKYKMIKSRLIDCYIVFSLISMFPVYWAWFLLMFPALYIARSIGFHKTFRK